ncbi:DUF427 domain-containing protein [Burkholderia glumae]|uniref:DUF427 domain-containing protein n=1 Tax=Burkholderia glumae TaxID=337 RepID=A0AAP9Y5R3_BURGL|nr:DUF427 domain-containing protein [Burkholderia glumae]ACR32776.1 Hypothetical protein bglu_2p1170 [Burkholderia glumae BGR1]AJY62293.1 hypothetical protein KS03_5813 [Burkholderia glumae LMG 2196 = ATCC 33617]KHJ61882.1 hypothetical protein NCPPB3923_16425 [Burkholderia glumae]MCM2485777.1 DUF427 domain-containing protein [Burkholderia glumae]MCM2511566.1 DUF427 domain-containing protein [Burkholderia glumae]
MIQAIWNGAVIAEASEYAVKRVEGNVYFPPDALHHQYFQPSPWETTCFWKGRANYYDIVVDDKINSGAAWYYANPRFLAKHIAGYVAFWHGVEVRQ